LTVPKWYTNDHFGISGNSVSVSLDPGTSFWAGASDDQGRRDEALKSLETRIAELRSDAAAELANWSVASEETLRNFLQTFRPTERPAIFLSDAGLLSAVWDGPNGEHVGLTFKDEATIFYVMIGPRIIGRARAHAEGSGEPEVVVRQLYAMQVRELVAA
jgi:hypothetical protein